MHRYVLRFGYVYVSLGVVTCTLLHDKIFTCSAVFSLTIASSTKLLATPGMHAQLRHLLNVFVKVIALYLFYLSNTLYPQCAGLSTVFFVTHCVGTNDDNDIRKCEYLFKCIVYKHR